MAYIYIVNTYNNLNTLVIDKNLKHLTNLYSLDGLVVLNAMNIKKITVKCVTYVKLDLRVNNLIETYIDDVYNFKGNTLDVMGIPLDLEVVT